MNKLLFSFILILLSFIELHASTNEEEVWCRESIDTTENLVVITKQTLIFKENGIVFNYFEIKANNGFNENILIKGNFLREEVNKIICLFEVQESSNDGILQYDKPVLEEYTILNESSICSATGRVLYKTNAFLCYYNGDGVTYKNIFYPLDIKDRSENPVSYFLFYEKASPTEEHFYFSFGKYILSKSYYYTKSGRLLSRGISIKSSSDSTLNLAEGLICIGKWERFYSTGELKTVQEYKDGEITGAKTEFEKNGNLKKESYFLNGKKLK